ncbi:unnamed protein product [Schistosoma curassoni]|nr:unnamed protein product [Schistosoma curassoni]
MDILRFTFGNLDDVFRIWLSMKMSTIFIPFWGVLLWMAYRPKVGKKICPTDWIFFIAYIIYQVVFFMTSFRFTIICDLPPASTAIVTGEQVRLVMKSHAFVRYAIGRIFEEGQDESTPPSPTTTVTAGINNHHYVNQSNSCVIEMEEFPNFSRYLYFLLAPTLVYREKYPRTRSIRWYFVFSNFLQGSGRGWNVVIWILLFIGWGQMICLYSMEWYARKNCPPVMDGYLNFFMPHIILCPSTNHTGHV